MHFDIDPTVQVAIVGGLFATMAEYMRRHNKAVKGDLKAVKHQVKNDHSTNLREDVDKVIGALENVLANQQEQSHDLRAQSIDIRQLREDIGQERRERLAIAVRLDGLTVQPGAVTIKPEH